MVMLFFNCFIQHSETVSNKLLYVAFLPYGFQNNVTNTILRCMRVSHARSDTEVAISQICED